LERPGIDCVESESIDELHYRADRGAVIARGGDGDASRRTTRTPALLMAAIDNEEMTTMKLREVDERVTYARQLQEDSG
jgi:hypothetical protein